MHRAPHRICCADARSCPADTNTVGQVKHSSFKTLFNRHLCEGCPSPLPVRQLSHPFQVRLAPGARHSGARTREGFWIPRPGRRIQAGEACVSQSCLRFPPGKTSPDSAKDKMEEGTGGRAPQRARGGERRQPEGNVGLSAPGLPLKVAIKIQKALHSKPFP